jgi:hypothetical protein
MSEPHSGNPDPFTSIFDGVDIISQYSDSEALADGLLVDIHHLRLRFRGYAVDQMTDNFNGFLTNIWQQYNDRGGEDTIFSELDQKLMLTELIGHAVNEDPAIRSRASGPFISTGSTARCGWSAMNDITGLSCSRRITDHDT